MRIAIISNIRENKGLKRDADILEALFDAWGHDVHTYDFRGITDRDKRYTVVFHLEIPVPKALSWSDVQVWIPNPDWCKPEYYQWAPAFRAILAKSLYGEKALCEAGFSRVLYIGFESQDRYLPGIAKRKRIFHSWCGSIVKGTKQVLRSLGHGSLSNHSKTILIDNKVVDPEYQRLQNESLIWIQPSNVEGFGHIIHEGASCANVVLTVNGPPMNEAPVQVMPARKVSRTFLADVYEATPEDIARVASEYLDKPELELIQIGATNRAGWLVQRENFRGNLRRVLNGL